jgi:hypothetical protein
MPRFGLLILMAVHVLADRQTSRDGHQHHLQDLEDPTLPGTALSLTYTVIRFISIIVKFDICTVVGLIGTLVETKILRTLEWE